jgi:hypothetical protein
VSLVACAWRAHESVPLRGAVALLLVERGVRPNLCLRIYFQLDHS